MSHSCPVQNWCVCEWAFAEYVRAKGCDSVRGLQCDSVNQKVLDHYRANMATPGVPSALECLSKRCRLGEGNDG